MPLVGEVNFAAGWVISPAVFNTQLWSYPLPFFSCANSKLATSCPTILGVVKSIGVSFTGSISPVVINVLSTGV